jgi:hypothetical protein
VGGFVTARLYLTVYADDDLPTETAHIASKSLGTVTACTELSFTKHLHGTDALQLRINRHHSQAALLVADRYVIVHSDAGPVGGAFLEEAPIDLSAAEGPGDEWIQWTGRGPISVLERGVMDNHSGIGDDPIDGFWDLSNQGDFAGASNGHPIPMMKRVMNEIDTNSPNALAVVDHSSWDYDEDTDAVTPPFLGSIVYGANVGDDALQLAADMSQLGGVTWAMSHLFKMDAHISYGTDRTGAFGAAGKVRFQKGVNIADAIQRKVRGSVLRTHLIVGGADRTYVTVTDPDYVSGDVVRWGFLSMPETSNVATLTNAGLAHIEARKRQTDVWSFPQHDHGNDIANGVYEPAPPGTANTHYWVGDTVTLHSGSGPYDANALGVPISAITWQLKTGVEANGDYWVIPQVGATFDWPPAGPAHRPPAPPSAIACEDLTDAQLSSRTATNGNVEAGAGTQWIGGAASSVHFYEGTQGYVVTAASGTLVYTFDPAQVFEGGTRYVIDIWAKQEQLSTGGSVVFGVTGDQANGAHEMQANVTGADGGTNWHRYRTCWTPSEDRTGASLSWSFTQAVSGYYVLDGLVLYTAAAVATTQPIGGSGSASTGTPGTYAPLGHVHEHGLLSPSETHHHGTAQIEGYSAGSSLDWFVVTDPTYGAVGDGTTDDTAAIQAAIDAAELIHGTVYFPAGTYKITSVLSVGEDIRLLGSQVGQGSGSTIVQATNSTGAISVTTDAYRSSISCLTIDGPATHATGIGIQTVRNIVLEDVWIQDFDVGIQIGTSSFYSKFDRVGVFNCNTGIYLIDGSNNTDITDVHIDTATTGIYVEGCEKARVVGGSVEGCTTYGIRVDSGTNNTGGVTLHGIYFENGAGCTDIAIGTINDTVRGGTILGCKFTNGVTRHIDIQYAEGFTIGGCDLRDTGSTIRIQDPATGIVILPNRNDGTYTTNSGTTVIPDDIGSVGALDDLTDVTITSATTDDDLRFNGSAWVNDDRKWEAVTNGEDVFVWEGDALVHDWST